jgi:HAD superfamily hydrolase (TIGR01450 family)
MSSVDRRTWVIDLDGVVWLAGTPIPGGSEAIAAIRRRGDAVLFATNNSAPTDDQLIERLGRAGIDAHRDEIVTAAHAAVAMVPEGASVLCIADGGVRAALDGAGIRIVDERADVVIVGWTATFDYATLDRAARSVREGAVFIGTNPDPTHPTPDGLRPGTGALIAAVEVAGGRRATYAGKPNAPMVKLIRDRAPSIAAVIGDQVATDGALATALAVPFGHVQSGVDVAVSGEGISGATLLDVVQLLFDHDGGAMPSSGTVEA